MTAYYVFAHNSFWQITPANLNASGKILEAYVCQTQISRVKILTPWSKEVQNGGKKWVFFVTGTMNSHFFVMGQIVMKFGQKTSIGVVY